MISLMSSGWWHWWLSLAKNSPRWIWAIIITQSKSCRDVFLACGWSACQKIDEWDHYQWITNDDDSWLLSTSHQFPSPAHSHFPHVFFLSTCWLIYSLKKLSWWWTNLIPTQKHTHTHTRSWWCEIISVSIWDRERWEALYLSKWQATVKE